MISIAIMGHGTVGSGVAEILLNNTKKIDSAIHGEISIKKILDLRTFDDLPYSELFTTDFNDIITDNDIKIVVETMGGINPAYKFVKDCLVSGKSVVTSNKELVAEKGAELLKIANDNNVNFLFEASVGGGIPILRPIAQCLAANRISEVKGILNGTTNYILNKMVIDGMDFDSALALAQKKGFAEKDPAADIEGHDACRKICILASLAFGKHVYPNQVNTEGITNVSLNDAQNANMFNCVIKLIGQTKKLDNGKISACVRPMLVPRDCILADVNGVFNAIMVTGDAVGDVMFYGRGAGKMPTASAVVADVIDCAKHLSSRKYLDWDEGKEGYVTESTDKVRLYISAKSDDFERLEDNVNKYFAGIKYFKNIINNEIFFITDSGTESELLKKAQLICADSIKTFQVL